MHIFRKFTFLLIFFIQIILREINGRNKECLGVSSSNPPLPFHLRWHAALLSRLSLPPSSWRPADLHHCRRNDSGIFLVVVRSSSLVDAPTPSTTDVWIIGSMIRYQEIAPLNRQCTREFRAVNSYFHETIVSNVFAFKYRDFIVRTWFSLHLFFTITWIIT